MDGKGIKSYHRTFHCSLLAGWSATPPRISGVCSELPHVQLAIYFAINPLDLRCRLTPPLLHRNTSIIWASSKVFHFHSSTPKEASVLQPSLLSFPSSDSFSNLNRFTHHLVFYCCSALRSPFLQNASFSLGLLWRTFCELLFTHFLSWMYESLRNATHIEWKGCITVSVSLIQRGRFIFKPWVYPGLASYACYLFTFVWSRVH